MFGLSWTPIGIEDVGYRDQQVLDNRAPLIGQSGTWCGGFAAGLHIEMAGVIGHNESLSSPHHREDDSALINPDARRLQAGRHADLPGTAGGFRPVPLREGNPCPMQCVQ